MKNGLILVLALCVSCIHSDGLTDEVHKDLFVETWSTVI